MEAVRNNPKIKTVIDEILNAEVCQPSENQTS